MTTTAFAALLSHWRRKPLQLMTLIMGIALATALWSGVQAINAEARASYARAASVLEQSGMAQIIGRDGAGIPIATYARLRRAGWKVSPVIEGNYRFGTTRVRLIGVEPLTMPSEAQVLDASKGDDVPRLLASKGQLITSEATARKLREVTHMEIRTSERVPDDAAFVDIGVADRLLNAHGHLTRLIVAPTPAPDAPPLQTVAPDVTFKASADRPDVARLTDSFHLNLTAFGFLSFVVGLFIVYSASGLSFEQRRGTFRTLRSLGVSLRSLTMMIVIELAMLALLSGLLGVALGYIIAWLLLPGVAATLRGLYDASVPESLSLRPEWWFAGLGIALGGTAVSSAQSLWRVWRMPILSAAQPRAWARATTPGLAYHALGGILLLFTATLLVFMGAGLLSGFAVLGCLLLGAALLLPALLSIFLIIAEKASKGSAMLHWFWADARLQLPGLSLALMALLLALATNIGVGTMVSSFRLTFNGWLDQRLAAELYVTARDEGEAFRLREWLPRHSISVLPIWNAEADVSGERLAIYGVADDQTYRDHWPLIEATANAWDEIAAGRASLINEQMWRRVRIKLGDRISIGRDWSLPVVGVYSDYGNPKGQIIVGIDALVQHFPDVPKLRYGVRVPMSDVSRLRRDLVHALGVPDGNIVDQGSLKRQSRAVFDQTFRVTGALNVLTLAVAGFAMFSSLLTLSGIRLPQLAPIWAMGSRRRTLVALEVMRALSLWAAVFLAAIPVGLALAWILLAIVNVEAFGWRLPMAVFPWEWLWLGLVAFIAACLSVAVPVRRLVSIHPADLLRVFANER
ncbi:FtsX-like permease family protein [Rhizobium grahamii]|uniref:FtsX family attachment transporter-like protein n=1 Tax=Rhizobium grahamii CCGE 502 TaxID=990285 RepID=S3H7K0_9HYPH|nr:ABC transporter permease [Rhizobium grahamii]EPE94619.1 FtsX family attachment transporter-like protein [Rhizobium grahamii CCGE 502]